MTARRYLPWVRAGAASLVTGGWGPARATVPVSAAVNGGAATATVTATLYGPGDVTGIDARQVIRTDPPGGTTDFESTLLPCVEFDEPALPWLFSPAAAADDRLRPWLVLVVVPADAASVAADSGRPGPVLTIPAAAGTELPDLDQSWAWAHVQVTAPGDPATRARRRRAVRRDAVPPGLPAPARRRHRLPRRRRPGHIAGRPGRAGPARRPGRPAAGVDRNDRFPGAARLLPLVVPHRTRRRLRDARRAAAPTGTAAQTVCAGGRWT